jgi:7-cyano-7-deazaguanine synthase
MAQAAALVLFSGGQDSTVCLAWALQRYARVETVGFAYGQRHAVELQQRPIVRAELAARFAAWRSRLSEDHLLRLEALGEISDTALTRDAAFAMTAAGLPNTFVPGRNLLFCTLAAALGYRRGLNVLIGGMCETDYSGYPDCRDDTLQALAQAISLGLGMPVRIETPLMWIDKAATWSLAAELGGPSLVDLIVEHTHTCYTDNRGTRHAWGYGCGNCAACALRAKGWEKWQLSARS